jgi:hypothetical protein
MEFRVQSFVQRRIGLRFAFEIESDSMKYSMKDASGERTIEIPYESVNLSQPAHLTLTSTPLTRRLSALVVIFGLLDVASLAANSGLAIIFALATFAAVVALLTGRTSGWSAIEFKLFDLRPFPPGATGPMRIIDDHTGAEIISSMIGARKAKFRRLYAQANLSADPRDELARLDWLKANEIISDAEWKAEVDRVNDADDSHLEPEKDGGAKTDSIH